MEKFPEFKRAIHYFAVEGRCVTKEDKSFDIIPINDASRLLEDITKVLTNDVIDEKLGRR